MALPGDHHHLQSHTRLRSDARQEHLAGCQRILHHQWHHPDLLPASWGEASLWHSVIAYPWGGGQFTRATSARFCSVMCVATTLAPFSARGLLCGAVPIM